jgi:hypothetical protein
MDALIYLTGCLVTLYTVDVVTASPSLLINATPVYAFAS